MPIFLKTPERTARLPEGLTEVEYLESTGTQYIDTGVSGGSGKQTAYKLTMASTNQYSNFD